jgi:hypothetical protein
MRAGTSAQYATIKRNSNSGRLPILDEVGIQKLRYEADAAKRENRIIRTSIEDARKAVMAERMLMMVRKKKETSLETFDARK